MPDFGSLRGSLLGSLRGSLLCSFLGCMSCSLRGSIPFLLLKSSIDYDDIIIV